LFDLLIVIALCTNVSHLGILYVFERIMIHPQILTNTQTPVGPTNLQLHWQ
jgi:hypothetical protein